MCSYIYYNYVRNKKRYSCVARSKVNIILMSENESCDVAASTYILYSYARAELLNVHGLVISFEVVASV